MSGPGYLGEGRAGSGKDVRSFRLGLNRRQEMILNKELNDLGQRTVNEVRVRKELEMRNMSPALDDFQRRVKEEFTSRRQAPPKKRPPHIPDLKTMTERRSSRDKAGLHRYNPLDKDSTITGPLRKYPYVKKDEVVSINEMKREPKMTSMGVIPPRKSTHIDDLRVVMEGSCAIPIDDRSIKEIETANTAPFVRSDDEKEEEEPADVVGGAPETDRSKPAILGQVGTTRQAPLAERPTRPSSRTSLYTTKRVSSAGSNLKTSKLTESKLNLHDKMGAIDKLPEDQRSEGSASTIRSVKELVEEAEAISGVQKKRKAPAKKKKAVKTDGAKKKKVEEHSVSEVSVVSRGRSVDEIIASLKRQQRSEDEGLTESDKKIQAIMARVLHRTQAVLGTTEEEEMDKITEEELKVTPEPEEEVESVVDEVEKKTVTIVEPDEYGSETATYEYPAEEVSSKMTEVEEVLAAIRTELEEEEERKKAESVKEEQEEEVEEQEEVNLDEARAVLEIPLTVTYEELVGIEGTQQTLHERGEPQPPTDHAPRPSVHSDALSFLSTWRRTEERPSSTVAPPAEERDRDEKSVHHFCSVSDQYQLPKPFSGVMRSYHAPAKYAPTEFSARGRFAARTATALPDTSRGRGSPQSSARDRHTRDMEDRLVEAAERVMREASILQPSHDDVTEWRLKSEAALPDVDIEVLGEKLELKDDDSRLFWNPAPAKLDMAPRYVKRRLFPEYKGAMHQELVSDMLEGDEVGGSESDDGDEVGDTDPLEAIRRNVLLNRRCKSSEDLTIYQLAKHEKVYGKLSRAETPQPTPRDQETPTVTSSKSGKSSKLKVPAMKPDPIVTPTFVRRRTNSAPGAIDDAEAIQIAEDFHSAMSEMNKQQENLKRHWEKEEYEKNMKELIPEPVEEPETAVNVVEEILEEVPELRQKEYEMSVYQKMQLRAQKKTPAELALEAGRAYVILPKKKKKKRKPVDPLRLRDIDRFLSEKPRRLERSESYRKLNPPLPERIWRVPSHIRGVNRRGSLPDLLNFETYAKKKSAPRFADHEECREWVRDIWNEWFDEVFPPEVEESDDESEAPEVAEVAEVKDGEAEAVKKKPEEEIVELADETDPVFDDDEEDRDVIIKLLEEEVVVLTNQINSANPPNPFHICRRGAIYKKLGKLRLSLDDLNWCLDLEPMLLDAYWHRHLIYLIQNKNKAALEDLNFLLKHNKTHANAYKSRAEIYRKLDEVTLSIMNYSSAIKLNPEDDECYFRRAEMYEARGDQLLALEDYSKTTRLRPHRTDALYKHATYHFQNNNWQAAISGFTEILNQEPSNAEARTLRGRAFAQLQQYNAAVSDFSAAVHLDPNNSVAFYQRACLLRQCHPQRALRDYSLSLFIDDSEDNILSYLHRGILYYELGNMEDAIADFEAVTQLNKDNACAHCNLGLIYYHNESYHRAVKKFSTAVMVDPTYLRAYLCRAEAYVKLHDLKNALFDLTRSIYLQPDIPHLYMYRGYLLLKLGHLDLAAYCIRNAACMNYDVSSQSATQQAVVQAFLKNYDKVIEILKFATVQKPSGQMQVLLGKMLMKAKLYEEAVKCFDTALWTMKPHATRIPWPREAAEVNYLKGVSYAELRKYGSAHEALNQAIAINGKLADAYYQRGLVRMKLRHARGVQDFNRSLALNPKSFQAYLSRAAYYGMKKQHSKAVLNCNEAIRLQPNSVRAYLYRGSLKYQLKAYDLAIHDLSTAILIDNQCHLAYFNRAICYHDNREYLKALTDYGIVLLIGDSLKVKVLINRGLLYYDFHDYGNALQDFLAAVKITPKDRNLHHTLSLCYHRLNQLEKSVRCFTRALELSPFFLDAYIGRGNAFMDFGTQLGLDSSRRDYEHCIMLDPGCLAARVNLAYNLQMRGKCMQAWRQFTAALAINPKFVPALEGRAIISLQMSNTFGAIQDITAALKSGASAELYTNRGVINQYMGDKVNAMRDYQKALTMDPTFALAYFNAGNMYFHSRQFPQAKDYFDKALTYNPKDESAYLNRAITKVMLKDVSGALDDFKSAIKLSPRAAHIYFNRANLFMSQQQFHKAEKDYSKVLSLQPADFAVYRCRADVRGKLGDQVGAVADYMMIVDATAH